LTTSANGQINNDTQATEETGDVNDPDGILDFKQKVVIAFVISFVTILSVTLAVNRWIKNNLRSKSAMNRFWFIVLDSNCYPSLALFQFMLWTFIISFSYLGIYLTRILNGQSGIASLDGNILILLGLSVSAPIINKVISNVKYASIGCGETIPRYSTMLEENGKISLTRFQFFLWTWVSIVIFFGILVYDIVTLSLDNIGNYKMPSINETLIVLMGLSQAGYLGAKSVTKINPTVSKLLRNYNSIKNKEVWTILGNGLGNDYGKAIVNGIEFDREQVINWNDKLIEIIPDSDLMPTLQEPKDNLIVLNVIVGARVIESKFKISEGAYSKI
jgi:hypothetical protein